MAYSEHITGIDIGSSHVRIVTLQRAVDGGLQVIGAADSTIEGVSRGSIKSIEEAVSSISECLERAEKMMGVPIENAVVGISGTHIITQDSRGVVAVGKANGEIQEEDVDRVLEAAQAVATPPNYEILHIIPRDFTVDNQYNIKDPIGMTGVRLEVNAQIILGLSSHIRNLTKCIYRTGVDILDLVFSILANGESTLNKQQRELGVCLVNIGASTTSILVYEEGNILLSKVIPVGSAHITNDIAIGLRTSIPTAEIIKLEYAQAVSKDISKREELDLADVSETEKRGTMVSLKYIAEIAEARAEEIFGLINEELRGINRDGLLPSGIVLTGGGAKLPGLIDLAKKNLNLPVFLGYPINIDTMVDKVNDPEYTLALGLAAWGFKEPSQASGHRLGSFSSVENAVGKMKSWLSSLLP
ncbi:MAG: cell division protein FtsA [Candidatus Komeilibacteria bacterium]|nr:cell division protein FtsA [Candidatus Komeilibacteria bacterium]